MTGALARSGGELEDLLAVGFLRFWYHRRSSIRAFFGSRIPWEFLRCIETPASAFLLVEYFASIRHSQRVQLAPQRSTTAPPAVAVSRYTSPSTSGPFSNACFLFKCKHRAARFKPKEISAIQPVRQKTWNPRNHTCAYRRTRGKE